MKLFLTLLLIAGCISTAYADSGVLVAPARPMVREDVILVVIHDEPVNDAGLIVEASLDGQNFEESRVKCEVNKKGFICGW